MVTLKNGGCIGQWKTKSAVLRELLASAAIVTMDI